MQTESELELQPTLWRTCRVLANRIRLRLLGELFREPAQSVSALAARLGVPLALTSQYLRDLGARGLLRAHREGRTVTYSPVPDNLVPQARVLLAALKKCFLLEEDPIGRIFSQVTAFTHPRRAAVVCAIGSGCESEREVVRATAISLAAVVRHLRKLRRRQVVCVSRGRYSLARPASGLTRVLLQLALTSRK